MTDFACDYSWARPNPASIKAGGFKYVCRYLSHDKTGKTLTKPEADALLAQGLGIILNFEDRPGRAKEGYGAGVADALFANALADTLGAPHTVPIYYSCDEFATPDQVTAYYRGCYAPGTRPVGVYGGRAIVDPLLAGRIVDFGWQANATSWDQPKGESSLAHMHQAYGHPAGYPTIPGEAPGSYDVSKVLKPPGAWGEVAASMGFMSGLSDTEQRQVWENLDYLVQVVKGTKDGGILTDTQKAAVATLKAVQAPGAIDYDLLAKKVADVIARRLAE